MTQRQPTQRPATDRPGTPAPEARIAPRAPTFATQADPALTATHAAPGAQNRLLTPSVPHAAASSRPGPGTEADMRPVMALRPYQQAGINAATRYLAQNGRAGLVVWPTGAGKSVAVAEIARRFVVNGRRVLIATHVAELVAQDAVACERAMGATAVGINAASLGRRDSDHPVIVASVHSIYRRPDWLGRFDLVMVDEAQMMSHAAEGMYAQLLANLATDDPVPLLGFTATPYRMRSGRLTDPWDGHPPLFDRIVHEVGIRHLIEQGYLVRPIAKATDTALDVSGVKTDGGDFALAALERAVNVEAINRAIVSEIIARGTDRRSWLVFATGVQHSVALAELLIEHGITAVAVHSGLTPAQRRKAIEAYRGGHVRALVNMNVLTTGFDAPATDLIAYCRPTLSPGLHVQMLGRGTRLSPETSKTDCMVLDFAGNVHRHGPIDLIDGSGLAVTPGDGDVPMKTCSGCQSRLPTGTRTCPACENEFPVTPRELKLETVPLDGRLLSDEATGQGDWLPVHRHRVVRHMKPGSPQSLRVIFDVPGHSGGVSEFLHFDHPNPHARSFAERKWRRLSDNAFVPRSTDEAFRLAGDLIQPTHVRVRPSPMNPMFMEIVDVRLPAQTSRRASA